MVKVPAAVLQQQQITVPGAASSLNTLKARLKILSGNAIINAIKHRSFLNRLNLPIQEEIKKIFGKVLKFTPVIIESYEREGDLYTLLEYKREYGKTYSKHFFFIWNFFFYNPWLETSFIALKETFLFITKLFVKFPRKNPNER